MSEIIPSEVFIIPIFIIILSFFTPKILLQFSFVLLNKVLKKHKTKGKSSLLFPLIFHFAPILYFFTTKFEIETIPSLAICLLSSAIGAVIAYLLSE